MQGPCDMAKTGLFEAQSPAMKLCILRHTTPGAQPPVSGDSPLRRPNPSGRWAVSNQFTEGDGQAAYVTLDTSSTRGIRDRLTGCEPYGDGVPIVVVGVTPHQGERESRLHGRSGTGVFDFRKGEVRVMRNAATLLEIIHER